jgi:hypothetical protein
MRVARILVFVAAALLAVGQSAMADGVTVSYNGKTIEVSKTLPDPNDLWVTPEDLTRINGFVLKPEGACLDDVCIPIKQDRDSDLLITRRGQQWFNVAALARKLQQTYKVDREKQLWTFGPMPFRKSGAGR